MIVEASHRAPTMPRQSWDLHCDLPMYLALDGTRSALDPQLPCHLESLSRGQIGVQICAIFTAPEPGARAFANRQLEALARVQPLAAQRGVQFMWAVEHAGGIFLDNWEQDWRRFDTAVEQLGPCAYLSLTWNGASRFGGGTGCEEGLSAAGRTLLSGLVERGVPLDFSHASDTLARDLLDWLDDHAPLHPVLASHSNLRDICPHPRNLPRWLWRSLADRGGCIGLCWYPPFIGERPQDLLRHVETLVQEAPHAVASGADLFLTSDPYPLAAASSRIEFFTELSQSAHLASWALCLSQAFGQDIAHKVLEANPRQWWDRVTQNQKGTCRC